MESFFTNLLVLWKFHHKLLTIQISNRSFKFVKNLWCFIQIDYSTDTQHSRFFRDFRNESGATGRLSCNYSPNYCCITEHIFTSKKKSPTHIYSHVSDKASPNPIFFSSNKQSPQLYIRLNCKEFHFGVHLNLCNCYLYQIRN